MEGLSSFKSVKRNSDGKRPSPSPMHNILLIVSDRSGSMSVMGKKPYRGVKKILKDQIDLYEKTNVNANIRLVLFSNEQKNVIGDDKSYGVLASNVKIPKAKEFECLGFTRLYDTVVENLHLAYEMRKIYIEKLPKNIRKLNPNVQITFVLITDGLDNASDEYTREDMQRTIEEGRENHNMTAFYLATDGSAADMADKYGFCKDRSLAFTPSKHHCNMAFNGLSKLVRDVSSGCYKKSVKFPELVRTSSSEMYSSSKKKGSVHFKSPPKIPRDLSSVRNLFPSPRLYRSPRIDHFNNN
tara:strand:+ start:189 stop:1082 length:894 start_codon:yes stop_codon:yes gene_type:complete